MYSPLNSDHVSSIPPPYNDSSPSINTLDGYSHSIELGDLSNVSLLQRSSEKRNHDGDNSVDSISKKDSHGLPSLQQDTSYSKQIPFLGESIHPISDERESTRPGAGWWNHQMLVDRTLRTMATTMAFFAILALLTCIVLAEPYKEHMKLNSQSSSVTVLKGKKSVMDRKCEAIKFLINIAATMILGMSNTYQQILTALEIDDLKYVLTKYGDSRVGTNSPMSINHKRSGRLLAWLAWLSLILTSLPVHLLANSLVGVSTWQSYVVPLTLNATIDHSPGYGDYDCWSALRLGERRMYPGEWEDYVSDIGESNFDYPYIGTCPERNITYVPDTRDSCTRGYVVTYVEELCGEYVNKSVSLDTPHQEWKTGIGSVYVDYPDVPLIGNCSTVNFTCATITGYEGDTDCNEKEYRLVVRMQAAFILAVCLLYKAGYMLTSNWRSRNKIKSHLLTFGDVIMASTLDPNLQIPNESMVNGGSFHRRQVQHTCHKHCKSTNVSETGEELGHCQKCRKHNIVNNFPRLPWPALATKRKQSLLSNLGQTALTQMLTLSFTSVAMILASVFALIAYTSLYEYAVCQGWTSFAAQLVTAQHLASLVSEGYAGEIATFWISNGAQLLYSMLYMLLIYNVTLISMEQDWSVFEQRRKRFRCTIVKGHNFNQSYLMQLPKRWLYPLMVYSIMMHWLLGLAIYAEESIISDGYVEFSKHEVVTVPVAVVGSTCLMLVMTIGCWWSFTYKCEGFIPEMYGSIRAICSATSQLNHVPMSGVQWGDLGELDGFRHAGLSAGEVGEMVDDGTLPGDIKNQRHIYQSQTNLLNQKQNNEDQLDIHRLERDSAYGFFESESNVSVAADSTRRKPMRRQIVHEMDEKVQYISEWLDRLPMPTHAHFLGNSTGVVSHDMEAEDEGETRYPSCSSTTEKKSCAAAEQDLYAQPGRVSSRRDIVIERKARKAAPVNGQSRHSDKHEMSEPARNRNVDTEARQATRPTILEDRKKSTRTATLDATSTQASNHSSKRRHSVHEEDDEPRKSRIVVSGRRSKNSEFPGLSMVI